MLSARELWCLDALSAEHNQFWAYLGEQPRDKIHYVQVTDFSCSAVPDDAIDFVFSYGTFCHITWAGQCDYYRSLRQKMRPGANAMIMIADFDKFNSFSERSVALRARRITGNPVLSSLFDAARYLRRALMRQRSQPRLNKSDPSITPGRLYHAGATEPADFLGSIGFEVVPADVGLCLRDPIVHFRRPAHG